MQSDQPAPTPEQRARMPELERQVRFAEADIDKTHRSLRAIHEADLLCALATEEAKP